MLLIGRDHSGLRLDAYWSPYTSERLIVEIRGVSILLVESPVIYAHYITLQAFDIL